MTFVLPPTAQKGFTNATSYDQHRPSYPSAAVSSLLEHLGVKGQNGARILEVGAGTGKFTELLVAREEAFEILAVEPHARMREELERKRLKGVTSLEGNCAALPLGSGDVVDAVVAAQAFHWFANDESLREIHRVLKSGGGFGMIWNVEDYNQPTSWTASSAWEMDMKHLNWSLDDGLPRFKHLKYKDCFEHQPLFPLFSLPLGEESVPWEKWLKPEAVWERFATLSHIALLEPALKEKTKQQVLDGMAEGEVVKNDRGEVLLHGVTFLSWTGKI